METVIQDLLAGEYRKPIRVVAFNTAECWSQDVSEDIAREIQRRCNLHLSDVPSYLQELVDRKTCSNSACASCSVGLPAKKAGSARRQGTLPASSSRPWQPRSTACPPANAHSV
ncbi:MULTISPECIES: hypothetical protein [Bradyrhizobium]|uniref:hypothetical protein n=1 Tax=Bradyrhizobium TaxID=374 RepID=UPI001833964E|nr:hypothetical protein [Bradyrhizobium japonicum]MCS3541005.1 hypothetical protein [Bradyrhizobium japonicum]MCS3991812.1 hypothetical protein [Bradyrhizobium japonicum]MCS4013378.1 hypothetical protein [Bradyrhizobium japonicum]MCS4209386.1 hypothetical protein [Bradyrhizobium japonicum]MDH6172142.1 hypothetical protein [Bradyrhizobium japonicum]